MPKDLAADGFFWNPRTDKFESCPAHSDCLGDNLMPMPKTNYWVDWDSPKDTGIM